MALIVVTSTKSRSSGRGALYRIASSKTLQEGWCWLDCINPIDFTSFRLVLPSAVSLVDFAPRVPMKFSKLLHAHQIYCRGPLERVLRPFAQTARQEIVAH